MASVAQVRAFIEEVVEELKRVTWPDRDQLRNSTLVVLGFVGLIAVIIALMDVGVRGVLGVFLRIFG